MNRNMVPPPLLHEHFLNLSKINSYCKQSYLFYSTLLLKLDIITLEN